MRSVRVLSSTVYISGGTRSIKGFATLRNVDRKLAVCRRSEGERQVNVLLGV